MRHIEEMYSKAPMAELASGDETERLRIYTYGYQFPDAKNVFDADWQMNHISLIYNGMKVEINGPFLEASHLKGYSGELLKFKRKATDSIDFISTDQQLIFFLTHQDGKIDVSGGIYNRQPENGKYVTEFNFKTNFILLGKFIEGIEKILLEYPSRPWIGDWC